MRARWTLPAQSTCTSGSRPGAGRSRARPRLPPSGPPPSPRSTPSRSAFDSPSTRHPPPDAAWKHIGRAVAMGSLLPVELLAQVLLQPAEVLDGPGVVGGAHSANLDREAQARRAQRLADREDLFTELALGLLGTRP